MITRLAAALTLAATAAVIAVPRAAPGWRNDPGWFQGKAEWALYDAVRPIYGAERAYDATIFTNRQRMDPATTTKAADWRAPGAVDVFKHNVSEIIETPHYDYRFLTTSFIAADTLAPFKVVMSSQEDCGSTYKQFVVADGAVDARQFSYFPDEGASDAAYRAPTSLAFHDALSLTLRDYPFDAPRDVTLDLVPDQTHTHATSQRPSRATVRYVAREDLDLPYGPVTAHHLRVDHAEDGGATTTDYWFAADPALRHVMVKYVGPYGVRYELKKLGWWAYWDLGEDSPE